jgi:hypothetical protein
MELLQVYKKNVGLKKLFSEVVIIDWYDDPITGVCKLDNTEDWYIYNLCYFDPDQSIRILTLIKTTEEWIAKFKAELNKLNNQHDVEYLKIKLLIRNFVDNYDEDVYLLKTRSIEDINYEIVTLPLAHVQFFNSVEDVMDQDATSLSKWINYFL